MRTACGMIISLAAAALLASPAVVRADDNIPAGASVDYLIRILLTDREDDTREDAAKQLGRVGGLKALESLDYAAQNDDDRSVRKEAKKAAEQVRERLAAGDVQVAPPVPVVPATPARTGVYTTPVVTAPAPVTAPPPVVAAPAPVYTPPPVVVAPAPVYIPPPVIYTPPPVIVSRPYYYYYPYCSPVYHRPYYSSVFVGSYHHHGYRPHGSSTHFSFRW